jgi:hypothetical protein
MFRHQDVHARLAEQPPAPTFSRLVNQATHSALVESSGFGHTRNLQICIARTDVGVETTRRTGHGIAWHERISCEPILFTVRLNELLDPGKGFVNVFSLGVIGDSVQEFVADRPQVGAARARSVVA